MEAFLVAHPPARFRNNLSENEFLRQFGDENQCLDALYKWRWPHGFRCPHCGHDRCCQLTLRKLQQCNRCRRQTSVTAGTIFDSTKLPLTAWFLGMYLMSRDRQGASAMTLHRHLGISYNAASRMKRKLKQAMAANILPIVLAGSDRRGAPDTHSRSPERRRKRCS